MYRHAFRTFRYHASIASLLLVAGTLSAQTTTTLTYPAAARGAQVDNYHGVSIADPYRWLEDVDSPATKEWVAAENKLTDSFLASIPQRQAIRTRLTQLWNYERYSAPFKENGRYFYFQNTGLQNQSVLYVQDNRNATPRLLLDPNLLSTDGTVALSGTAVSDDGRFLAYSLSTSGSDWQELHVRDIDTGRDLSDVVKWVKFSDISWTHDNKGFFYSRYDEPTSGNKMTNANKNHKLYYHRVGQPQSRDERIYDRPDQPDWLFDGSVTDDGQYLIITVSQGTDVRNRLYFVDLDNPGKPVVIYSDLPDHRPHGWRFMALGPDNKLYFSVGDQGVKDLQSSDGKGRKWTSNNTDCRAGTIWRCDLDGKNLELIAHNFRNEYEPCVDSFGTIFVSDNDDDGNQQTRICYVMPGGNYGYWPRGPAESHWHEEKPGVVPKILRTYFGSPTGIDFPGESAGLLPGYWSGSTIGNVPIGQGIAVTPMQMASAYAAIANGGLWTRPHLVERVGDGLPMPVARHRIVTRWIARERK